MTELLKQGQYSPMNVFDQVISIFAGSNGFLDDLPTERVLEFENSCCRIFTPTMRDLYNALSTEKKITDEIRGTVESSHC